MTPRTVAFRLAAYYAALFATVGVHLPFWPLWLKDKGLEPSQIGLILAATYLVKMVVNPVVGAVVDRNGDRRRPMTIMAALAALGWMVFAWTDGFWPILIVTVIALGLWSGIMPVGDNLAMMTTYRHKLDYGRVRLWGSAAFIVTATLTGRLLGGQSPSILVWLIAAALGLTALTCAALPDTRGSTRPGTAPMPMRQLVTSLPFLLFVAAGSLNQMAHTVYYAFASIHWRAAGISDSTIGLLWAEGVIAEILLFAVSGAAVARLGPTGLLLTAGLAGSLRWLALGLSTDVTVLALVQGLHAATFGCAHLGAMHFIQRAVPHGLSARAQGLYSAVALGAAPGLMSPLTGRLYDSLGGGAFLIMAGLSALCAAAAWQLIRSQRQQPQ